ncbi:MAG: GNAT family N-acetyltransferase [Flavobacteriaceae bacterium]|nr:GNAT family N-acetyltransferase [Flavobacteriaceae bacterium]
MVKIIPYSDSFKQHFIDLNIEWLETYFYVEEHDADLLNNCKKIIIDRGGFIFFYQENDTILGTFALIKVTDSIFELGKMAVSPEVRGKGIGQKLMQFCIAFSKKNKWDKLILYSNTKLENSIYIYRKFGFNKIEIEVENPYARGNIKMELTL